MPVFLRNCFRKTKNLNSNSSPGITEVKTLQENQGNVSHLRIRYRSIDMLKQWFSKWGPRSPWGPQSSFRGTAKTSRIFDKLSR